MKNNFILSHMGKRHKPQRTMFVCGKECFYP